MTEPLSPQRLAEIRALSQELRYPTPEACDNARRELLAEVDRLNQRVAELEGAVDGCRAVIKQRDARVAELEAQQPYTSPPAIDPDHTRAVAEKDRDLFKAHAEELAARNAELARRVAELQAEREQQQTELDRLWYFIDANDRLNDVITGRPDHYIINGDHSGCACGTDWTPPPVHVEWGVEWGSQRSVYPYDDERSARAAASDHESHVVVRRLVGLWQSATTPGSDR